MVYRIPGNLHLNRASLLSMNLALSILLSVASAALASSSCSSPMGLIVDSEVFFLTPR